MNKINNRCLGITIIILMLFSCTSSVNEKGKETDSAITDSLITNSRPVDSLKMKAEDKTTEIVASEALANDCACNVIAYVTKSPPGGIELFNEEKVAVNKISFDEENEEFIKVTLKSAKNQLFQIQSLSNSYTSNNNNNNNDYSNLWIDAKHLNIFLPDANRSVHLFDQPKENSKIIHEISTGGLYSIQLLKCCNNWIYGIHFDKDGKQSEGWFHPDDICSTPITNC